MSTTFYSDGQATVTQAQEPCLCAQGAERWSMDADFTDPAVLADLRANASATCPWCHGSGVDLAERSDRPELNLNEGNAVALLSALGLDCTDDGLCGELGIPEARRAAWRASARGNLEPFVREGKLHYGAPRKAADGTVELRPLRAVCCGLSAAELADRISRFAAFVEAAAARGATEIRWG